MFSVPDLFFSLFLCSCCCCCSRAKCLLLLLLLHVLDFYKRILYYYIYSMRFTPDDPSVRGEKRADSEKSLSLTREAREASSSLQSSSSSVPLNLPRMLLKLLRRYHARLLFILFRALAHIQRVFAYVARAVITSSVPLNLPRMLLKLLRRYHARLLFILFRALAHIQRVFAVA